MNVAAGDRNVVAFHVVNIALHAACALPLFGVARGAFSGADVRRVHPLAAADIGCW